MAYAFIPLLVALVLGLGLGYLFLARRSSGLPEVWVAAGDARIRTELAVGVIAKARGLSNRDELPDGRGMLFSFGRAGEHSFWMRGMRFPIDIVWIRDGAVVGVTPDIDPQRGVALWELRMYRPPEPADEVLELPAGYAAAHGIAAGTRILVEEER